MRAEVRRLTGPASALGALGNLEIGWQRRGSAQPQHPHRGPLAQRQRVADGIVVESPGEQHPGFGVGQLRDQRRRQRRRIDHRQRRRQLVFGGFARGTRRPFGCVGQCRQPLAVWPAGVGVDGDGARHHRASGQSAVERLPGQVVAHVQPVQPVGGLIGPRTHQHDHGDQHNERNDHYPGDQLTPLPEM